MENDTVIVNGEPYRDCQDAPPFSRGRNGLDFPAGQDLSFKFRGEI